MKFKQKLQDCFKDYTPSTCRVYSIWPKRLIEYHHAKTDEWIEPEDMTQWQIDEYLAQLVRGGEIEYSDSTVNQAARAIKIFFDYIGNPVEVTAVSTGHNYKPIDTISETQAIALLDKIPDFYLPAVSLIYSDFVDTKTACSFVVNPYRNTPVSPKTINSKIKQAARDVGIVKPVSIMVLRQSGIVHQLKATNDPAWIAQKCGLKKDGASFRRYLRSAGMLGPVGRPKNGDY
jgi:site-specific recombinase XerD